MNNLKNGILQRKDNSSFIFINKSNYSAIAFYAKPALNNSLKAKYKIDVLKTFPKRLLRKGHSRG